MHEFFIAKKCSVRSRGRLELLTNSTYIWQMALNSGNKYVPQKWGKPEKFKQKGLIVLFETTFEIKFIRI